jgi:hypothetical protein
MYNIVVQLDLKRELLEHLGIKPGERLEVDKLPGGELRVKAARLAGTIDSLIGRHAGKVEKPLTIEEMNDHSGTDDRNASPAKLFGGPAIDDNKIGERSGDCGRRDRRCIHLGYTQRKRLHSD